MPKRHPIRPHLRAWRQHLERTQEWLAAEIGTRHSSISRSEKGQSGLDDRTFAAIAEAYGITTAELSMAPADAARAREIDRILLALHRIDDDGLRALRAIAERMTR